MRTRSMSCRVCWRMGWPMSSCMTNTVCSTHMSGMSTYMHRTVMCNTMSASMTQAPQQSGHNEEKQSKQETADEHKRKRVSCD